MYLTFSPIRGLPGQSESAISVAGDILTIDGSVYDLSGIPDGGEATPNGDEHPFIGTITREGGVIHATIRVVLDDTATALQPSELQTVFAKDGAVVIPATRHEEETRA